MKEKKTIDQIGLCVFLLLCLLSAIQVGKYLTLSMANMALTALLPELLIVLIAWAAWQGRMPFLLLAVMTGGFVLNSFLNYAQTTLFAPLFLVQGLIAAIWAVMGTVWMLWKKEKPGHLPLVPLMLVLLIVVGTGWIWKSNVDADRAWDGHARRTVWAVPAKFDTGEIAESGTIEELYYQTKAYATDGRAVTKRALVYLPYGYEEGTPYNILYLMHGTGDDENYWLQTHPFNRIMLDRMIAQGEIAPLIVVTPTFYVEDDGKDSDLDILTFSFREELRNDLMPAVESEYSTWAESADDAGFAASRGHRAFAGLSRGAVTTGNSVLCGSLDWFSYFGLFSSFRTTGEHIRETMQSDDQSRLSINYLYATTGNFDFATPSMIPGYRMLCGLEPRLKEGVNTSLDIFPMRYHSIGHWHLALYNFLLKLF